MARRKRGRSGAPKIEAYSEWVRVDPVKGRLIDRAVLSDSSAARLGGPRRAVQLEAARNEYCSFQVVVRSRSPVGQIRLGFSGLTGPKGAKIGRGEFEPYAQWYHDLGAPAGWIPDALVPLDRLEQPVGLPWKQVGVPQQTAQGFWVDIFVPRGAAAGEYEGQLTVDLDGKQRAIPLRLQVWPFAIPDKASMVADMNAYASGVCSGWADLAGDGEACGTAAYLAAERATFRCAHEHRSLFHYLPYRHSGLIPHPSFIPRLAGAGKTIRVTSWAAFDRHFGAYLDGSAFRGTRRGPIPVPYLYTPQNFHWPADFAKFGHKGYATEWRRVGREFVDHFRAKRWTHTKFELFFNHKQRYKFFPWDGDEIRFLADADHMYHFRDLSAGVYDRARPVKFIWRVDSSWVFPQHCRSELIEFVKLWVVNSGCMAEASNPPAAIEAMHEKDCDLFHYGGASPLGAPLSWVWMWPTKTFARRVEGFTWWQTIGWNPNIWRRSRDAYATCVFYPGTPWGGRDVVGGIRAKAMRNAMQTIEYAYLLDRRRQPGTAIRIMNRALGASNDFWWDRRQRIPRDGSDAAALDSSQLADPLSWPTVRRKLAAALRAR
jgi:hypothetical protein